MRSIFLTIALALLVVGCDGKKTSDPRLSDSYWSNVVVDQALAQRSAKNGDAFIISGLNVELKYSNMGYYVLEMKDGTKRASVAMPVGGFPVTWYVDCANKRYKNSDEVWTEIHPKTKGGNILVHICNLPSIPSGY